MYSMCLSICFSHQTFINSSAQLVSLKAMQVADVDQKILLLQLLISLNSLIMV